MVIRIESQPESHRIRVVHGYTEANRVVGYAAAPRRGVSRVRWKYPVRKLRLGYARYMHGYLGAVAGPLPADHRPFQRHVRVLGGMKCYEMRLINGIFRPLQPITKVMTRAEMTLAVFPEKQVIVRQ